MINNYTKNELIPRPEGKKYTKSHILMTAMIIYLKGIFKIEEIEVLDETAGRKSQVGV